MKGRAERKKFHAFESSVAKTSAFANPLERELLLASAERRDGDNGEKETPAFESYAGKNP